MSDSPYVNDDFLDVAELAAWLQHHPCATCGDSPPRTASPTTRSAASSGSAARRSRNGSTATGGARADTIADRPEPLRLFDLADNAEGDASEPETARRPSRNETLSRASRTERTARPSDPETRPGPSHLQTASRKDETAPITAEFLRQAADAATMEEIAQQALAGAVVAARDAGHSWRAIGIATGIPHQNQTLHRQARARGVETPGRT